MSLTTKYFCICVNFWYEKWFCNLQEQTYVIIKDLQPNSMYFLQVQSISQYGLGKLRSEKAAIFYNTTNVNDGKYSTTLTILLLSNYCYTNIYL